MSSVTPLIALFGLLEPKILTEFNDEELEVTHLGSFYVRSGHHAVELTCNCGRSKPYVLDKHDFTKIHPASGSFACEICVDENKNATSTSDKISVWFNQNKKNISKESHLHFPGLNQRLLDKEDKKIMRPRRFVYTKFFDVTLGKHQKILCACGDESCINPYHMMVAASAAAKVTPDMKKDVQLWFSKNVSPRVVQEMLKIKYNHSVSLKTITNLKKSLPA
jgi:hypothetical protein